MQRGCTTCERRARRAPLRLDALALLHLVREERVVGLVEEVAREEREAREDVTRAGAVLAALQARAELAARVEEVDVVGADVVLREAHDGGLQARLAVVVRRVLAHVARELRHLHVRTRLSHTHPQRHGTAVIPAGRAP